MVTINLTHNEAQVLKDLCYFCISGPPDGPRGVFALISKQLAAQGVASPSHYDSDKANLQVKYTGGAIYLTAREPETKYRTPTIEDYGKRVEVRDKENQMWLKGILQGVSTDRGSPEFYCQDDDGDTDFFKFARIVCTEK